MLWLATRNGDAESEAPPLPPGNTAAPVASSAPPATLIAAAPALPDLSQIIRFQNPSACKMTSATELLFRQMTRIDPVTFVSSQGPEVRLPGFATPPTPTFSRSRNTDPGYDVRDVEATLPMSGFWHGLRVSRIRYRYMEQSSFWEMQIRFLETPGQVRETLNGLGFRLPAIGTFRVFSGPDEVTAGIGVEQIPGGAALTCGSSMYY
jgi:hypothetical protein